jgi:hypothetical protein
MDEILRDLSYDLDGVPNADELAVKHMLAPEATGLRLRSQHQGVKLCAVNVQRSLLHRSHTSNTLK